MRDLRMTKEQEEVFNKNVKFAYSMASKWSKEYNIPLSYEELCLHALEALVLAVKTYDSTKNCSFCTYAHKVLTNVKRRAVQRARKFIVEIPTSDDDFDKKNGVENDHDFELQSQIQEYLSYCGPEDIYIFKEAILKKRSKTDIAKELGLSHQTVYTRVKCIKEELNNFLLK